MANWPEHTLLHRLAVAFLALRRAYDQQGDLVISVGLHLQPEPAGGGKPQGKPRSRADASSNVLSPEAHSPQRHSSYTRSSRRCDLLFL